MFYSKKTGKMKDKCELEERMSSAELALYLKTLAARNDEFLRCPVCDRPKGKDFKFCRSCELRGNKFRRETLLGKARKHSEELAKKARMPRKNRKKGRVITKLMSPKRAHESQAATEPTSKPKTILRQSNPEWLWHVILLKATKLS